MSDLVQGGIVALIGALAMGYVLRQALRRIESQAAQKPAGCGGCTGCSGGGCGPQRR
jgi:FeoB-associated Cys-rich membrane protein